MSNKDDWLKKAEIDYFSKFVPLWLAFNSWYRSHYPDISNSDRAFLNHIKEDCSPRNALFTSFKDLMTEAHTKKHTKFISDIEAFHYSLNRADLKYCKANGSNSGYKICYENSLLKFESLNDHTSYEDITIPYTKSVEKIKLNEIAFVPEYSKIFASTIEIIYQIRCYLFHGELKPEKDEHEAVKYSYELLKAMMGNLR